MRGKFTSADRGDVFAFSERSDADMRAWDNAATIMSAPWQAYWAFAFEAMDPKNYQSSEH